MCTAPGDRVPGPRSFALMSPVLFPWREAVDTIEEVGALDSYTLSMKLSREGLVCWPSSGFNLQGTTPLVFRYCDLMVAGLYNFLEKRKSAGNLHTLADRDGSIHCVFLCCDLPYQYIDEYFAKLDANSFHPIRNQGGNLNELFCIL